MDDKGDTLEIGIIKLWADHGWQVEEIRISGNTWAITAKYVATAKFKI
jgi:hypothetical protein